MVYYAYSLRRLLRARSATFKYALRELAGYRGVVGKGSEVERRAYDADSEGKAAPHTDWISIRSLRALCQEFSRFSCRKENFDSLPFGISRRQLLSTFVPAVVGLDLYARLEK